MSMQQHVQYVLLFLVLVVNSNRFQTLQSYMLLLKPLVLMCAFGWEVASFRVSSTIDWEWDQKEGHDLILMDNVVLE